MAERKKLAAVPPLRGTDTSGHCPPPKQTYSARTLDQVHATYRNWFGKDYDLQALDCVLSVAAAERLAGDPAWLLLVGGAGAAKTETISPVVTAAGAVAVSTINGEAALLSGTSRKDRAKTATGGLLQSMGDRGLLVIKDVTSILSMNRDSRAAVLAALREVYDGHWSRNVGTDGGMTIHWRGRLVVIGAVTTAWDSHHQVIATMGDRFVLVRLHSTDGAQRRAATRRAMGNVDHEKRMRTELGEVVAGLLNNLQLDDPITLTDDEVDQLIATADLVTRTRTAVERDFQGNPQYAHALEMPTRFGKQLVQIVRGGIAIGMDRPHAIAAALRCAGDSLPPLRYLALRTLVEQGASTTADVVRHLQLPRNTVDRTLKELQLLGLLSVSDYTPEVGKTRWVYEITSPEDAATLKALAVSRNVETPDGLPA